VNVKRNIVTNRGVIRRSAIGDEQYIDRKNPGAADDRRLTRGAATDDRSRLR
jgi:hypothetical protein